MLRAAVAMFKGRNWKKVAQCFDNRKTEVQVRKKCRREIQTARTSFLFLLP